MEEPTERRNLSGHIDMKLALYASESIKFGFSSKSYLVSVLNLIQFFSEVFSVHFGCKPHGFRKVAVPINVLYLEIIYWRY